MTVTMIIQLDLLFGATDLRTLLCCTFNAQSIVNKLCELHHILYQGKFDIVFITESWLHEGISSGLLDPESQYYVIRNDRANVRNGTCGRGGGVCALISRTLTIAEVFLSNKYKSLELLCFDLLYGRTKLRYFIVYRPPNYDRIAEQYMELLVDCLTSCKSRTHTNIIIGDLNCPKINWQLLCCSQDSIHKILFHFVIDSGFCQFVDFPTRGNNVLDVVLADDDQIVTAVRSDPPIGHSDHLVIRFTVVLDCANVGRRCDAMSDSYKWRQADFDGMHDFLSDVNWQLMICTNPSANAFWETFLNVIHFAIDQFVPKHTNIAEISYRKCKRYPRNIRELAIKKRKLWKQCRENRHDPVIISQYRECVNNWRQQLKSYEKQIESQVIDSNNLGAFYKHINKRITYRNSIGALLSKDGNLISEDGYIVHKLFCFSRDCR